MRRVLISAAIALIGLALARPALAGGYDMLFEEPRYFRPGATVSLNEVVYAPKARAALEGGPYGVYLAPAGHRGWPRSPADSALLIGTAQASPTEEDDSVRARLTFTIPRDVRPGHYFLEVCANRSCREWLGALGPTKVGIATTSVEARLLRMLNDLDERMAQLSIRTRPAELRRDLRDLTQPLYDRFFTLEDDTEATLAGMESRLERLQARLARAEQVSWYQHSWLLWGGAAALGLSAGLLGASIAGRTSRLASRRREPLDPLPLSTP
jgi:hypothetical protein